MKIEMICIDRRDQKTEDGKIWSYVFVALDGKRTGGKLTVQSFEALNFKVNDKVDMNLTTSSGLVSV